MNQRIRATKRQRRMVLARGRLRTLILANKLCWELKKKKMKKGTNADKLFRKSKLRIAYSDGSVLILITHVPSRWVFDTYLR